jgi:pimeloyl-ACP methyl ester carboxylesterase
MGWIRATGATAIGRAAKCLICAFVLFSIACQSGSESAGPTDQASTAAASREREPSSAAARSRLPADGTITLSFDQVEIDEQAQTVRGIVETDPLVPGAELSCELTIRHTLLRVAPTTLNIRTGRLFEATLPPGNGLFAVHATVDWSEDIERQASAYLYRGDFQKARADLLERLNDLDQRLAQSEAPDADAPSARKAEAARPLIQYAQVALRRRISQSPVSPKELATFARMRDLLRDLQDENAQWLDAATRLHRAAAQTTEQDGEGTTVRYWQYLPEGYADRDEPWPLVIFLHGAGERGDDLAKVTVHGLPKAVRDEMDLPFVGISPQCPAESWWPTMPETLDALLDHALRTYHVDEDRVAVTGLSMGGFGTWAWAADAPDRFAALAPICGGINPIDTLKITHIPQWVVHGVKDPVVPFEMSKFAVDWLRQRGADVRFTVVPDGGHNVWSDVYADQDFWDWLTSHYRMPDTSKGPPRFVDGLTAVKYKRVAEQRLVSEPLPDDWQNLSIEKQQQAIGTAYDQLRQRLGTAAIAAYGPALVVRRAGKGQTDQLGIGLSTLGHLSAMQSVGSRMAGGRCAWAWYRGPLAGADEAAERFIRQVRAAGHEPISPQRWLLWWRDRDRGDTLIELQVLVKPGDEESI